MAASRDRPQNLSGDSTSDEPPPISIAFDDVLEKYIGGFGWYQVGLFFMIGITAYTFSDPIFMNFVGYTQDHWCHVEELSHLPEETQKMISIPIKGYDHSGVPEYESCLYYKYNYTKFTGDELNEWNSSVVVPNTTDTERCNNGWNYDRSLIRSSIVSRWDLVCGKGWMVQLVSTIYIAGLMGGSMAMGPLSDRFGRKVGLWVFVIIKIISGFASALAPNYLVLVIAQFFLAMGTIANYVLGFSLLQEVVAPGYRTLVGMAYAIIYSVGFMSVPAFAVFIREDMPLQLVMAALPCMLLVSLWFVPESPRWLLLNKRYDEAQKTITKIASINGKSLPKGFHVSSITSASSGTVERSSVLDVFRSPLLRKRCAVLCMHWFTDSLIFFALSLNSASLFGSIYLNTFLLGAVEVPANLTALFMMNWARVGRRGTASLSLALAGLACLLCVPIIMTEVSQMSVTILSLVGKAGATAGFNCIFVYTAELYPTEVRNIGFSICSFSSRISGMLAPYVGGPLGQIWAPLPSLIFGSFGLLAAGLSLFLPETLGTKLSDTIAGAEQEERDKKLGSKDPDNMKTSLNEEEMGTSLHYRPQAYTNEITKF